MKLTVIILTFNEERHLARCIASVQAIASEIIVADCFSTDAGARRENGRTFHL